MGIILNVPNELKYSFFFTQDVFEIEELDVDINLSNPFVYEVGFYNGLKMPRPWENPEEVIPYLQEEWKKLKIQLGTIFTTRDIASALVPMKQAIGLFIEMLFWSNAQPVCFPLNNIQQLEIKPVNIEERIEFIISRPMLYHSYVQLTELFIEQEKHFTKMLLLKNK